MPRPWLAIGPPGPQGNLERCSLMKLASEWSFSFSCWMSFRMGGRGGSRPEGKGPAEEASFIRMSTLE